MISVVSYTPDRKDHWDALIQGSPCANLLFYRNFMEYHADRFNDASVLVYQEDRPVAVFPANLTQDGQVVSHQGLTYGGIICATPVSITDMAHIFREITRHYHESGFSKIVYKRLPDYFRTHSFQEDLYPLFLVDAQLVRRDTSFVIPLKHEVSYQNRRKRGIRKAEKAGVTVEEGVGFEPFWEQVLIPNLMERHGVKPVHSKEEIQLLHSRFPHQIKQYNALLQGEVVAGMTVFEHPGTAHAQYISANETGKNTAALDLLADFLVGRYRPEKQYFSLGISNEQNGRELNLGLAQWKEGFGAVVFAHDFYEFDTGKYTALDPLI